jgi:hypothetical protein
MKINIICFKLRDMMNLVPHHSKGQCLKLTQVTVKWSFLTTSLEQAILSEALYFLHVHSIIAMVN